MQSFVDGSGGTVTRPTPLTWTAPRARHLPARVRHASVDSGADGPVWNGGGDTAPTSATAASRTGSGVSAVSYNAEVPLLFSEIDPVQNNAVECGCQHGGFSETTALVWPAETGAAIRASVITIPAIRRR